MDLFFNFWLTFLYVRTGSSESDVIEMYPNISHPDCGLARVSLVDDSCFKWFKTREVMGNIENGRDVRPGEMPWIVKIESEHGSGSGSILNERWVITCAHVLGCLHNRTCSSDIFKIYTMKRRHEFDFYRISNHSIHLGFTKRDIYDIALIKLNRDIDFSYEEQSIREVNSICLPKKSDQNMRTRDEYAIVTGFGATSSDPMKSVPGVPKMGWVRLYPSYNNKMDNRGKSLTFRRIPFPNGTVFCMGDSGGPVVQYQNGRAMIAGVITSNEDEGHEPRPHCVTKANTILYSSLVSFHIKWINCSILGHNDCDP